MSKVRLKLTRVFLSLALALVVATGVTFSTANPAAAAGYCQCTTYVANHYGFSPNYPNAEDWGYVYLPIQQGWIEEPDDTIGLGDIVVFQGSQTLRISNTLGGSRFNYTLDPAGHVGIVTGLTWHNNPVPGYYTVEVQGANQHLTPEWTASNCTDVSQFYFDTSGNYSGHWAFWY